jgi:hypothetical protein
MIELQIFSSLQAYVKALKSSSYEFQNLVQNEDINFRLGKRDVSEVAKNSVIEVGNWIKIFIS